MICYVTDEDDVSLSDESSEEGSTQFGHIDQSDELLDMDRVHLRAISQSEPNIARIPNRRAGRHVDPDATLARSLEHAQSMGSVQTSTPKSPKSDSDATVFHGVTYLGTYM